MTNRVCLFFPAVLSPVLLCCFSLVFSGCYTIKQGTTMLGYLNRAIPLEKLAEMEGAEENRRFAELVADILSFAMEDLGLNKSKNYTRYVELDRNYLAVVVSASAKDSFTPHQWWFPFINRVPYKGFFNIEDARKERDKLEKKDLDVWIRNVDAFSTLGWFRDPLYSYMKDYPVRSLADLIIHELLHATVYLKNHSAFNESLAEFVGTEGARLYMEKRKAAGFIDEEAPESSREDSAAYLAHIRSLIAELDLVYNNVNLSREEKLIQKENIIESSKARFEENYNEVFQSENYRFFSSLPVNNAYLGLFHLYHGEDSWLKDLYEKSGKDLRSFVSAAQTLRGRGNIRTEFEAAIGIN